MGIFTNHGEALDSSEKMKLEKLLQLEFIKRDVSRFFPNLDQEPFTEEKETRDYFEKLWKEIPEGVTLLKNTATSILMVNRSLETQKEKADNSIVWTAEDVSAFINRQIPQNMSIKTVPMNSAGKRF